MQMPETAQQQQNQVTLGNGKVRAVSERYDEQIAEDIVYDLIDEVGFWMLDGGKAPDRTDKDDKAGETTGIGIAPGGREIKELVQDD